MTMRSAAPGREDPMLDRLARFFASRGCPAYLVGGYVRDRLLSLNPQDLDVAVAADPQDLGRELARELGGAYVPVSPAHGVARVVVRWSWPAPDGGGPQGAPGAARSGGMAQRTIDLAQFAGTIEEDLARRDFTVNALAVALEHWPLSDWSSVVLDPFHGRRDLARRCIRAVGPDVFREDPGRLLRAVRLAARLGFRLDPDTAAQVRADAPGIDSVSGERVREELLATLAMPGARGQLEALDRLDLLCRVIPELALTKGVEQPRAHHYWDVWGHLLHCVEAAEAVTGGHRNSAVYSHVPWTAEREAYFEEVVTNGHNRRTVLKLAALFHDIAKPQTKGPDFTGRIRFLGHSELGAEMAARRLAELRVSSRGIGMVRRMVEEHLRPAQMSQGSELPTARAIFRYYRDLGDVAVDTLYLSLADYLAAKGPDLSADRWAAHARIVGHILAGAVPVTGPGRPPRLVTGDDLMRHLDLPPGPLVGRLLDRIEEARAAGEIASREDALALAARDLPALGAGE
jgi:poly(A) polymerase